MDQEAAGGKEPPHEPASRRKHAVRGSFGLRLGVASPPRKRILLPVLRLIEIGPSVGGSMGAFKATAQMNDGQRLTVCVKPRPAQDGMAPDHLYANWCGSELGSLLAVPVPAHFLVRIEPSHLTSVGRRLAHVRPGLAYATIWQEGAVSAAALIRPDPASVRNGYSVAAAEVLDSLFQYNDRSTNVLLVPAVDGSERFDLCFIDNGWLVWIPLPRYTNPLRLQQVPDAYFRNMIPTTAEFDEPVFLAESFGTHEARARFVPCPREWRADGPRPSVVAATVAERARGLRTAIYGL